ncbi:MAG: ROK family protein [Hyphomicrobiales bacterium]
MSNRIGIDVGGTKIDAVVLSPSGATLFEKRIATPRSYDALIAAIAGLAAEARLAAGDGATVGLGAPGSQSPRTGLWRNANITFCNDRPFVQDLQAAMALPLKAENDANCFALSEALDGAGRGYEVVAFFTIGTALGGGLVIDGRLRTGPNAEAAEFGHTPLPRPDQSEWPLLDCFCGKKGCAELHVSGTGLARDYGRATGRDIKGKEIVARARAGEAEAKATLARLQDRFARVCANIVNVVDPDIFVIGGGLNDLPELVEELPPLISRYSFSGSAQVRVARAQHGEKSGVRGAARLWG